MGRLTRRVKFIAKERRLSIPAEFLQTYGISRKDKLRVATDGQRLFVFPMGTYDRMKGLFGQTRRWFPSSQHPFIDLFKGAHEVTLGSQDRVVLPRSFPFQSEDTIRLHWEIMDEFLVLEPEGEAFTTEQIQDDGQQISLMSIMGGSSDSSSPFQRETALEELQDSVKVKDIRYFDRTYAQETPIPTEAMVNSIKVQGILRPILLRKLPEGGHQILDGFKRVSAARALKLPQVPALVWENLDDKSATLIVLSLEERQVGEQGGTVSRLKSALRLHSEQVGLNEIEKITGRRKRTLQRYLRVAQHPELRDAIENGRLSIFKAEEILKAGVEAQVAIDERWTVAKIRANGKKRAT